ncbi:4'-phosphopantetheinyl transferase superfamily protein [Agrobacterium leguminum]|uniref:Enterobactin synthase component D n=1 Tax=Agrobacterium deltaense NCPPB 1641 TaxID=1183425 RepID=A0A1S7TST1_9HYPH|nr:MULTISPECIES: 4'-phosphopantetheinyl transferase superfamily protein [Agrobacterium]WFS69313.1 4'-phosphopantetheinyl transferase superfamily protein [Agrobacterium leguminum]CVI57337.1 hypothetical protein AGR7A_Lc10032 [Agrobacterium deltaense NCPPB 1641]
MDKNCQPIKKSCIGPVWDRLFPEGVFVAARNITEEAFPLLEAEEAVIRGAIYQRRTEFSVGRHCARQALARLGFREFPILKGDGGAPVWPPGVVGSITHSTNLCIAVVALKEMIRSVGVDTEIVGAVTTDLADNVLRPDEPYSGKIGSMGVDYLTLIFCIKEAVYKAHFQLEPKFLDFHDVRVRIDPLCNSYIADVMFTSDHQTTFKGRYGIDGMNIIASCWKHACDTQLD